MKRNTDNSTVWTTGIHSFIYGKSLAIDTTEQSIYLETTDMPNIVMSIKASTGTVNFAIYFTTLSSGNTDNKIFPLSDNSGFYLFNSNSTASPRLNQICKYLLSTPSSIQ